MKRLLTILALLAPAGCLVGPQEELPGVDPNQGVDRDQGADAGGGAEADGDGDLDDDPPVAGNSDFPAPDDGDDFAAEGEDVDEGADPSVQDVEGATVPGVPIPRPGMPSPEPDGPDLDAAGSIPIGASDLSGVDDPSGG